jgi:hypothetical protein
MDLARWQAAWHYGLAPNLKEKGLLALRHALMADLPHVAQRYTTWPLPTDCEDGDPLYARPQGHLSPHKACPLGYCGWRGDDLDTIGQVHAYVAGLFTAANANLDAAWRAGRLAEPVTVAAFLHWVDDSDRAEMWAGLIKEIELELARRAHTSAG